tara:strand:- start:899 stop:1171 length:273 start_codon:yes stop_codon:yes gene_type:complete
MTYFFLIGSSFFNFCFYIFAIGFLIALILEQVVRKQGSEQEIFIVTTNRKFLWRQAWIVNIFWFLCNILLSISMRSSMPMGSDLIWRGDL